MIFINDVPLRDILDTIATERNNSTEKLRNVENGLFDIVKKGISKNSEVTDNRYMSNKTIKNLVED